MNLRATIPMNCLKVLSNGDIRVQMDIDASYADLAGEIIKLSGSMVEVDIRDITSESIATPGDDDYDSDGGYPIPEELEDAITDLIMGDDREILDKNKGKVLNVKIVDPLILKDDTREKMHKKLEATIADLAKAKGMQPANYRNIFKMERHIKSMKDLTEEELREILEELK